MVNPNLVVQVSVNKMSGQMQINISDQNVDPMALYKILQDAQFVVLSNILAGKDDKKVIGVDHANGVLH